MSILNFHEINDLLYNKISNNESFSCLRIDNTAGYVLDCLLKDQNPSNQFYNENTLIEGGIFPNTLDYAINVVLKQTLDVMLRCDILGFVDISNEIRKGEIKFKYGEKPMFFNPDYFVMDPAALLGHAKAHFNLDAPAVPWTKALKGKKVLIISTHSDTIKHQWKNIDSIWGSNRDIIAPFELVDCIRSPYHPSMDNRQPLNCSHYMESVESIKNVIDTYDYDVLLSGSTTSSPFYVDHAKSKGKIGIQTGGTIQLFFGILGYRWTEVPGYSEWHKMYNEHWMYALESDEAQNRKNHIGLETNFAYWKK